MNGIRNGVRLEAERVQSLVARVSIGIVDGYDPSHYAVKVRLQPENVLTGWLPLTTPWAGNGWGMYAPPSLGDIVEVHFQQGGSDAGFVVQRFFSTSVVPLSVPSGELWQVHQSGSLLKFHNDGSVEVTSDTNMTLTAGQILRLTAPKIQVHATTEYRFDANGHGQAWLANKIDTYQTGEVAGSSNPISPPEIGD